MCDIFEMRRYADLFFLLLQHFRLIFTSSLPALLSPSPFKVSPRLYFKCDVLSKADDGERVSTNAHARFRRWYDGKAREHAFSRVWDIRSIYDYRTASRAARHFTTNIFPRASKARYASTEKDILLRLHFSFYYNLIRWFSKCRLLFPRHNVPSRTSRLIFLVAALILLAARRIYDTPLSVAWDIVYLISIICRCCSAYRFRPRYFVAW